MGHSARRGHHNAHARTAGRGRPDDMIATALQQSRADKSTDNPDSEQREGTHRYLQTHIRFPRRCCFPSLLNPR